MDKVVALKEGFFGGSRQRVGAVFSVPKGTKGTWLAPARAPADADPEAKTPAQVKRATSLKPRIPATPPPDGQPDSGDGANDLV